MKGEYKGSGDGWQQSSATETIPVISYHTISTRVEFHTICPQAPSRRPLARACVTFRSEPMH